MATRGGTSQGLREVPARVLKVNRNKPRRDVLDQAVIEVFAGGIVAYPTETFYGLGVNAMDEKALSKLFELKGRPKGKPTPMLIPSRHSIDRWVTRVTPLAKRLMDAFWPGPLTIIFTSRKDLPSLAVGSDRTVGLRETSIGWVQRWVEEMDVLLTTTSANRSGHPAAETAIDVVRSFNGKIDLILDGDGCLLRQPSTVVDARRSRPVILRQGIVPNDRILQFA